MKYRLLVCTLTLICSGVYPLHSLADCQLTQLVGPRDSSNYTRLLETCKQSSHGGIGGDIGSILGYIYRHGYGVPRDLQAAKDFFNSAIQLEACHPYAICGLRGLQGYIPNQSCEVNCNELAQASLTSDTASEEEDAQQQAYRILADLQRNGEQISAITDLRIALEKIITQEKEFRNQAQMELCLGYIKRAVVTVAVAYKLDAETNRRRRLIKHLEDKIKEQPSSKDQKRIQTLKELQQNASADKQVFFEKYTSAVYSATACNAAILQQSYTEFEREISEVSVTEVERIAYSYFQNHVQEAQNELGIGSEWFNDLPDLLK